MNRTRSFVPVTLAMLVGLATGCSSSTEGEQSAFLVTSASSNGTVSVVARRGSVSGESSVTLSNTALGIYGRSTTSKNGFMFAPFPASSSDRIEVQYTAADGTVQTEEVAPQEGVIAAHGLLTVADSDGDESTKPCYILVRDDVEEGSDEPTEVLVVPPCGCGHPPKDGSAPSGEEGNPPPQDGSAPSGEEGNPPPQGGCQPPPQDGETPPPDGEKPPCGCGHPPPQDGQTPPPDGEKPPCPPPVDLEALVGTYITVVGQIKEPKPDAPCEGIPLVFQEIVPDEESGAQMAGRVETESLSDEGGCLTFSRTDLFDAAGLTLTDYEERYELVGDQAEEIALLMSSDAEGLVVLGFPVVGHLGCGYDAFEVTSYELSGSSESL